jgi:hypothetical protein
MKALLGIALALAFCAPSQAQLTKAEIAQYCYDGFHNGIHSTNPIRVAVTKVESYKYHVGKVEFRNSPEQQNKVATILLVSILNEEAVNSGSDTAFQIADDPRDADLTAEVTLGYGDGEHIAHTYYYVSVDYYGMGITSPNGPHIRLAGVHPDEDYSLTTPGAAATSSFHKLAKFIVSGWICNQ